MNTFPQEHNPVESAEIQELTIWLIFITKWNVAYGFLVYVIGVVYH